MSEALLYAALACVAPLTVWYISSRRTPRMPQTTDIKKINIVVVGGGAAGCNISIALAKTLDPSRYSLVLVTSRTQSLYLPATLRAVVDDEASLDTVLFSYEKLFSSEVGSVKTGTVEAIHESEKGKGGRVKLSSGEALDYDALVLATGCTWSGPPSFPNEENACEVHIQDWRRRFRDAHDIVIVGGGPVGIETAGEIKDVWADKRVTIVHAGEFLLSAAYPDKFRKDIERRLRSRGIDVVLGDHIDDTTVQPDVSSTSVKTRKNKTLACDLLVPARGGSPNTSYASTLQPSPLTDNGHIKVSTTLQVQSHPSIFALGDIIDWLEVKQFAKILRGHVPLVTANLVAYLEGKELKKHYSGTSELIFITNGKNGGATYFGILWGLMFGDSVTRLVKSRDLMVGKTRKSMGL